MHLTGMCLMNMHLVGVHLMLMGVDLPSMYPIYLCTGQHLVQPRRSLAGKAPYPGA
jgi:hypothetical protein